MEKVSNDLLEFIYLFSRYMKILLDEHCNQNGKKNKNECTLPQFHLLVTVAAIDNCTITDIVKATNISKPTVSILISKLELLKLVKKTYSKDDKRSTIVSLTDKGKKILDNQRQEMLKHIVSSLQKLEPDEIKVIEDSLKGINKIIKKYEVKER